MNAPDAPRHRPPVETLWQLASVLAYVLCQGILAYVLWRHAQGLRMLIWLLGMPIAWVASDFISGFVHWLADNCGHENTPILGRLFVRAFRDHHRRPNAIAQHDGLEAHGDSCLISLLILLPAVALLARFPSHALSQSLAAFICELASFVLLTTFAHRWAHMQNPPWYARALQRSKLVLDPTEHQRHHAPPHTRAYCITSGVLNGWADRHYVFARLGAPVQRWLGEAH